MPGLTLPGPALAGRALVLRTVPAGAVWRRMFESRFPDPLGWGHGRSRFSDPTGTAFGLVYLGSTAKVCFVETILRDRADGRGADCVVAMGELSARSLARIRVAEPLRLVDLAGDGGLRMGVPSDVAGARDHALAQQWAAAFHAHPDRPDGIHYPSRLNEDRCIALFDRALRKLRTASARPLLECRDELAAILDGLEIAVL